MIKLILTLLILTTLVTASEEIPNQEEVAKLYVATFNRAPDKGGLDYWINSGLKLSEIAQSFFDQPETQTLYPSGTSNADFITSVYANLFNRTPDTAGLNYWENELNIGSFTKNSFIQAVINGAQNTATSNDADILSNKTTVGLSFSEAGKTDVNDAKNIMIGVSDNAATMASAVARFGISLFGSSDNNTSEVDTSLLNDITYKNEPYYKYQWHLDSSTYETQNIAFKEALSGFDVSDVDENADININEAWKYARGASVYVAVIDDGVDVNHEDIKDNLFKAYNADDKSTDISNKSLNKDTPSHGNTCAGFITSSINGKGTVGTAPSSKLIAIKIESSLDSTTIEAFEYAKNNGAKVISCSWGTEQVSDAIVAELKSLYDAGITVLFASGNDAKTLDSEGLNDESEVEWVIGVGSSAENNDIAEAYSNYGSNLDIIAPGGDASNSIGILCLDDTGTQGSKDNYGLVTDSYHFGNGTSYATPVAAGVVALMYDVNPNITPKQVKDILISTADKVGATNANYIKNTITNQTFDEKRAYGKINAGRAVVAAKALNN